MKKRILSLLTVFCLVFTLFPAVVGAAEPGGEQTYDSSDPLVLSGSVGDLEIYGGTEDSPLSVQLNGTVMATGTLTIHNYVTLTGGTLKRNAENVNTLISIADGGYLSVSNATIDGGADWPDTNTGEHYDKVVGYDPTQAKISTANGRLIHILDGGHLNMFAGAVLQNNCVTNGQEFGAAGCGSAGGALFVEAGGYAYFYSGSTVTRIASGNAVFVARATSKQGNLFIYGGTFSYNYGLRCNNAYSGAAIRVEGNLVMTDADICYNSTPAGHGAGLWLQSYRESITGGKIHDNYALYGGGIRTMGSVTISNLEIYNNTATYGGGLSLVSSGRVNVANCSIQNNKAEQGGAIYIGWSTRLVASQNTFSGNTATTGNTICMCTNSIAHLWDQLPAGEMGFEDNGNFHPLCLYYVSDSLSNIESANYYDASHMQIIYLNGGTMLPSDIKDSAYICTPSRSEYYTFGGWYKTVNFTEDSIVKLNSDGYYSLQAGTSYYAKWVSAITFDSNGGSDVSAVEVTEGSAYGNLPEPTYEGYTFVEWVNQETGTAVTSDTVPTGNTTLVARWKKNATEEMRDTYSVNPVLPKQTYSGKALEPAVTVYKNEAVMENGYTCVFENNTNVGKATVKVSVDETEVGSAIFDILPATPVVTLTNQTFTVGDTIAMNAGVTLVNGETYSGQITYTYYSDENGQNLLTEVPTEVGIYYVQASIAASKNYIAAKSNVATLTIESAPVIPEVPAESEPSDSEYIDFSDYTFVERNDGWTDKSAGTVYYMNGVKAKGEQTIDGEIYYFDSKGYMQTGWIEIDGNTYYHSTETGARETGWVKIEDNWFYMAAETGIQQTGWVKDNNTWYYLENNDSGKMVDSGVLEIEGETYYFYDWGGMANTFWYLDEDGSWYFFGGNGVMKKDTWVEWKGIYYYVGSDGKMLTDTITPDGYQVDADGKWVQ